MGQPLWKTVRRFFKNLKLLQDLGLLLLGMFSSERKQKQGLEELS